MVAASIQRSTAFTGVRPLEGARDLGGVAEVLAEAFRGEMDSAGKRAVSEMHAIGRLGPLAWWLDLFAPIGEGFSPGFVWVEDGRIVGNATVRRTPAFGRGHIVGNVAVLPDYRGHGIGRQLMQACLERARDEGSEWVALEVRADNMPARHLYLSLGFQQTGAETILRRNANTPVPNGRELNGARIRKPRSSEDAALFSLAQAVTPSGIKWAEPLRESEFVVNWDRRFDLWLSGRGEVWWVAESGGQIVGAVRVETFRNPNEEGRLRMWIKAEQKLHAALMEAAIASRDVQARSLSIAHPAEDVEALQVFTHYGFQPALTLAHMKLNLR
jgi:ribosomal protein S18 acetylase RimI-like enzyme